MSERREIVAALVARGLPERLACRTVGLGRSSYRYRRLRPARRQAFRAGVEALAQQHPRYGYRRIAALLRRRGERASETRVRRVWQEAHLQVRPHRRSRPRRGGGSGLPTQATARGHVWTYDFVFDRTEDGPALKMLIVLDEYTRECHRIHVGRRLGSAAVLATLAELVALHGAPRYLRSDNGGEFIAAAVQAWLADQKTGTIYITPGHPWENGYAESFIGKFRDECLNLEIFLGEAHAAVIVEQWRRQYNEERPHSALGYRTPAEVAAELAAPAPQGPQVVPV